MSTSDVSATDSGDTMDTAEDESLDMGDEALDMGDVNGNSTKGRPILSLLWFALARAFCLGKLFVCLLFCLFLYVCLLWVTLPVFCPPVCFILCYLLRLINMCPVKSRVCSHLYVLKMF